MTKNKHQRTLFLAFFLSGLAALVYEIVWAKKLGLIFGTTTYAISTVLAVFFMGLALGSFIFGRLVDRFKKPLLIYALLELGIGIYAFFTPQIFELIKSLQILFWQSNASTYLGFSLFTFLLSATGLIIPTTLMGGTLPVISKFFVVRKETLGEKVSILYAVNTAGAIFGVISAGFILIIILGVNQSIYFAAVINILIGLGVLGMAKGLRISEELPTALTSGESKIPRELEVSAWVILVAYALSGFAALALEVLWTRVLVMILGNSTYAFSIMLITFLFGIAVGSAIISKFIDKKENILPYFVATQVLIGFFVILSIPFFDNLPFLFFRIMQNFSQSFLSLQLMEFFFCSFMMLIPTLLMGAAFPIAVKAYKTSGLGVRVGEVYAANTIGGVFGSLTAGFLLIPFLGIQKSIVISAIIYFLVGSIILLLLSLKTKTKFLLMGSLILVSIFSFYLPKWSRDVLTSGVYYHGNIYLDEEIPGEIIFYKEGLSGTITVRRYPDGELVLQTNGKVESSTRGDLDTQLLSGHLPLLFHPNPESVLVIGLGGAFSLGAVEQHQTLTVIDAIEIEPAIVEAASYFSEFNNNALEDPRLNLILADARNYILATDKRYDVIASEPSNPWIKGMGNLFTKEFFELCEKRLKPGGIMGSWIHLYSMSERDLKTTLRTFQEVFPHTAVFINLSSVDLLLLGSEEELAMDYNKLVKKFEQKNVQKNLSQVYINDAATLMGYFLMDGKAVSKFSEGVALHTDNQPILEFSAPKSLYLNTIPANLSALKEFQSSPFSILAEVDNSVIKDKIQAFFDFRKGVLTAEIFFNQGKFEEASAAYEKALVFDPSNERLKERMVDNYNRLGEVYIKLGRLDEAREKLEKSLKINSLQPRIQKLLELLKK